MRRRVKPMHGLPKAHDHREIEIDRLRQEIEDLNAAHQSQVLFLNGQIDALKSRIAKMEKDKSSDMKVMVDLFGKTYKRSRAQERVDEPLRPFYGSQNLNLDMNLRGGAYVAQDVIDAAVKRLESAVERRREETTERILRGERTDFTFPARMP